MAIFREPPGFSSIRGKLEELDQGLRTLEGLTFVLRPLRQEQSGKTNQMMKLDIVGPDRPGILQDVMNQLVGYGINVVEMETEVSPCVDEWRADLYC